MLRVSVAVGSLFSTLAITACPGPTSTGTEEPPKSTNCSQNRQAFPLAGQGTICVSERYADFIACVTHARLDESTAITAVKDAASGGVKGGYAGGSLEVTAEHESEATRSLYAKYGSGGPTEAAIARVVDSCIADFREKTDNPEVVVMRKGCERAILSDQSREKRQSLDRGQSFSMKCTLPQGHYKFLVDSTGKSLCFNSPCGPGNKWPLSFALKRCFGVDCTADCEDLYTVSDLTRDDLDVLNRHGEFTLDKETTVRLCFENRSASVVHLHRGFRLYAEED